MTTLATPHALKPSLERGHPRDGTEPREAAERLMVSLLGNEPAAAHALYARYASRIFGLGLVLFKNRADAEDLVQDTFLKVWRTGSTFDPHRVARRLDPDDRPRSRDRPHRRRTLETRKLSSQPIRSGISDEPGPEWYGEYRDLMRRARKAVDGLPRGQRSAMELAYLGQRTSTEVAKLKGIPPGTVKSRIRLGMVALRQSLSDDDAA